MWFLKIIIISVIFIGKFYEFKGISKELNSDFSIPSHVASSIHMLCKTTQIMTIKNCFIHI